MTTKHLLFRSEAREKVLRGATLLADAVRVTLGPKSKSVLIGKRWGTPIVCNDGVTIARELELEDAEENLGVQMMRQAAERTGDAVGDGTTTSTLLAHAIYAQGLRSVVAGASAIDIKRGLEAGLKAAVTSLRAMSRPVQGALEKVQIATISAHNDSAIGALVGEAVEKVGRDGVITVEEAKGTETEVEIVRGMQFDRGYLSPYFVTDAERMECVLEEPFILLFDKRIAVMNELLPLLEQVAKTGRGLVIIAEDVEGEALATLVVNKLRHTLACAAVKAPGFGDRRKAVLEDLAVLTGGHLIAEEVGAKLERVKLDELGRASRVVIDHEKTTIVGGSGDKAAIAARVELVRRMIRETKSDYDRERLEERLAKLSGGVAVVRVGAPTEAELKARKEAFEDAISATRAAAAEGVVPGAGLALLRCADAVLREEAAFEGDVRAGMRVLRLALEAPARQIADNSGVDDGVVIERMRAGGAGGGAYGFDASTGGYVDLYEAGIIDPTKGVRIALENAVSVAGVLLLTEATLTDLPEPPPKAEGPRVDLS